MNFFSFGFSNLSLSHRMQKDKKYLAKLKGCIGEGQYKEKESRRQKSKRQENLDLIQEKDREQQNWYQEQKRLVKQLLHLQHTKQTVQ